MPAGQTITLMLCGDVMTGRGIDQIMAHPGDPALHESWATSALDYVALAEEKNGPIARPVADDYVWGDALAAVAAHRPDLRIVNLETAVTVADRPWPKGINYRMHPLNVGCLKAFAIDCCVLANNHILDWGRDGLAETLDVLAATQLASVGAGKDGDAATAPAQLAGPAGRVLVHALACRSSGVPADWQATAEQGGVNFLAETTPAAARRVAAHIAATRRPGDLVVGSLHWGANWGYDIAREERDFAHALIDDGAVDVVHGHSSHHPKAIEVYRGKLVLYGCGDFLNDYEGIAGQEGYRGDLVLAYLATFDRRSGRCLGLRLIPFHIRRFRLNRPTEADVDWLQRRMDRQCRAFGGTVAADVRGELALRW